MINTAMRRWLFSAAACVFVLHDCIVAGQWLSGAAGDGAANGEFGTWRGTPISIGGTWNDGYDSDSKKFAQLELWTIQPGAEWGSWNGPLDIAIGAIYKSQGETWAKAATGSYDARWKQCLLNLKVAWGSRTGTLYIRFAHEFNGDWMDWSVKGGEVANFKKAWIRIYNLKKKVMPSAKLVFCPSDDTAQSLNLDFRKAFPGPAYVDVMSVDSYNQYPFVNTAADFQAKINKVRAGNSEPIGIEQHRLFALSKGKPFAISEWSSRSTDGDGDEYVRQFRAWILANAGTGKGNVLYEIFFNVGNFESGLFQIYPTTNMPAAAQAYVDVF